MSLTPFDALLERFHSAFEKLGIADADPALTAATDPRFGEYQSNAAMGLAKTLRKKPREIATDIVDALDLAGIADTPEIAGPGFINISLTQEYLLARLDTIRHDNRLGLADIDPRTILIDFSSPNVAKPMHVGHIRSTVIGDCLARVARFCGHRVITDNHIGDWGTQFGMVIYGWKHELDREALERDPIAELVRLYRSVNAAQELEPALRDHCREELVKLQQAEEENLRIWLEIVDLSWREFERVYKLLDVRFDQRLGESFYRERLGPIVDELLQRGIAEESEGAICIFFPEDPELAEKPCLIRKKDGGFLYATSDLATIEYRRKEWSPDSILYVVGAPQRLHFQQLFAAARRIGWDGDYEHVAFGSILGEDRKLMRTRSGESVALDDLLGEAVTRARKIVAEKNPELPEEEADEVAQAVGVGAIKYSDLTQHRMTDYVFSWDRMLSFEGNTAPYLQNAAVRIRSIFRRSGEEPLRSAAFKIDTPEERTLAIKLLRFAEAVPSVLDGYRPNLLCTYLYELATTFHSFYEACPVLKAEEDLRASRLSLCALTLRTLETGLDLLGIRTPERM